MAESQRNPVTGQFLATHRAVGTPEHNSWVAMLVRCRDPKHPNYRNYGGRGIKVCDRWRESFENFYADMGPRPAGTTLDRVHGNGDYCPANCRWATTREQRRNTRQNRYVTINNVTRCVADWADISGINLGTICQRLNYGWPPEKAVFQPKHRHIKGAVCSVPGCGRKHHANGLCSRHECKRRSAMGLKKSYPRKRSVA